MENIPKVEQNEKIETTLYHVSNFEELKNVKAGDTFLLNPGQQNAEGLGVYFSQDKPRHTAAEGAGRTGIMGVVVIKAEPSKEWWRSKGSTIKKFNRPRTWHTYGKSIILTVEKIHNDPDSQYPTLECSWEFKK